MSLTEERLLQYAVLPANLVTIGELIDFADSIPADLVMWLLPRYFHKIEQLIMGNGAGSERERRRNLVVLGTLTNRALFEICDLPQDREFKIR